VPTIEVYADIWCPFAHVGLQTAAERLRLIGRDDIPMRVRAWPLELVNGSPLDAEVTAHHVAELRAQVAPELFAGFDPEHFPSSSLPALALAATAYRRGDVVGEAASFALRDALFEQGRDVSDPDVLSDIAAFLGIGATTSADERSLLDDWRVGQERGVKGSPHFYCEGADMFCPSLDIAKDTANHLQIHPKIAALNDFLADCLTGVRAPRSDDA
jgi:predicted DsbA family dithiol-disulfide isomerase